MLKVLEVLKKSNLACGAPVEIADKAELCRSDRGISKGLNIQGVAKIELIEKINFQTQGVPATCD